MAENSKIEWTHHTFNPWRGCTKVSDGCKNCYAETLSGRNPKTLGVWGRHGTRVIASESMWRQPLKWDKAAALAGERHRVFCASLADVFEGENTMPAQSWLAVQQARGRLYDLIERTPNLDWLLLTKRPENIKPLIDWEWLEEDSEIPANVWIGTSVENQEQAEKRIPELLEVPAKVRFLSMEPLLGSVDLSQHLGTAANHEDLRGLVNWVIVGGESGVNARPLHPDWVLSIRDQCEEAKVPFFFKQWGEWAPLQYASAAGKPLLKISCDGKKEILLDGVNLKRFGKKAAGRDLDGREWSEFPNV